MNVNDIKSFVGALPNDLLKKGGSSNAPILNAVKEKKDGYIQIPGEWEGRLIKPLVGFKQDILKRLSRFPYNRNVFLMLRFRESNKGLSDYIVDSLERNGYVGVRADQEDWNITNNVYNPIAVLYCCKFGIALFDEPEELQAYNPNVVYELGLMHNQHKDCLILRHRSLPKVPFDLVKDLYNDYDKDLQVKKIIDRWVKGIQK